MAKLSSTKIISSFNAPPNAHPLSSAVPLDLFPFLGAAPDRSTARILFDLLLGQPFKKRMLVQFVHHPFVESKDVGAGVEQASNCKVESVFREQVRRNDPPRVSTALEVGIGVQEENFLELERNVVSGHVRKANQA